MQIKKLYDNTWCMEEESGIRFFLLTGEKKALFIDSGMQTRGVKKIAQSLTSLPIELLNTHADPDHIGANDEFDVFYMHPAEASNYYNTQKRTGDFIPVEDGELIDLGGRVLRIIALAGHTPGGVTVLDADNRALIGGDPIQDGDIFMFGVQREMHAYVKSLEKIEKMIGEFDAIYPSHGSLSVGADIISKLRDGALRVLAGEVEGVEVEVHGKKVKRYDVGVAGFLCD